jgi:Bacterial SH3 domain
LFEEVLMSQMVRRLLLFVFLAMGLKVIFGQGVPEPDLRRASTELTSSSSSAVSGSVAAASGESVGSETDNQTSLSDPASEKTSDGAKSVQTVKLYVTGSKVNLRDGPSLKGKAIGQLAEGTEVELISNGDGWVQIQTPFGPGWMAARFLSTEKPAAVQQTEPIRTVAAPTLAEISRAKAEIIRQSIASYPGSCPCPYNSDKAGRRCGGRSAWSKPGGYSPICYESDISEERLQTYFARLRGAAD